MSIDSVWIRDNFASRELPLHSKAKSAMLLVDIFDTSRDKG